jgi:hypothetical protein
LPESPVKYPSAANLTRENQERNRSFSDEQFRDLQAQLSALLARIASAESRIEVLEEAP